jgi:hypothetical protein
MSLGQGCDNENGEFEGFSYGTSNGIWSSSHAFNSLLEAMQQQPNRPFVSNSAQ